jgi:hypothetical protein
LLTLFNGSIQQREFLCPVMILVTLVVAHTACLPLSRAQNPLDQVLASTPTDKSATLLRGGPGAFGAPRGNGATHAGVDLVANKSSSDKSIYRVMAPSDATVAYARLNGSETTGYGYTLILDHRNGVYTLYAHLAINASKALVKRGNRVHQGQVIGYLADLTNNERSSGNVRADVVKPYDKIQLHLESFNAPSGRSSDGSIEPIKRGATLIDPTLRLKALGYQSY